MNFILNTIMPSLGVITSNLIYLSPLMTVQEALKTNNANALNSLVYSMMIVNGSIWMIYGCLIKNWFVFLANFSSIPLSVYYYTASIMVQSSNGESFQTSKNAAFILMTGESLVFLTTGIALISGITAETGISLMGAVATAIVLLFIASPLSSLYHVISTKSASSIDPRLAIAQLLNGFLWLLYGICISDPVVFGPNIIGILVATTQLILKRIYPEKVPLSISSRSLRSTPIFNESKSLLDRTS